MCWNNQIYNMEPETYTRIIIVVQIKLNFLAACEKGRQRETISNVSLYFTVYDEVLEDQRLARKCFFKAANLQISEVNQSPNPQICREKTVFLNIFLYLHK